MPRVCLSMIVKDEAPVIERCLASVAPLVDCWIIVDTGSTDSTPDIIRRFFAKAGIPGQLHRRPWRDFAFNRTEALELSRPMAEYSLIIDADDAMEGGRTFSWPNLTADGYTVQIADGTISYSRTQLVRNALPWRYRGVLHEFLTCEGAGQVQPLPGLVMRRNHDGARRRDPTTYARDAKAIEDALLVETDPMLVARYLYYLGQSYRDQGEFALAAAAYKRRVDAGGWEEERWSAELNRARCLLAAGDGDGFFEAATNAFSMRSHRAEPLLDLSRYMRTRGEYEQAMIFSELATHIPRPTEDRLFIEDFAYSFGFKQELSIAGFYCAEQRRKDLGRFASNDLALDRAAPADVRGLARQNLAFYARRVEQLMPSWTSRQIAFDPPEGWHAMNPSIASIDGRHQAVVRTVNFTVSGTEYLVPGNGPVMTRNYLVELDTEFRPATIREILSPPNMPETRFALVLGFEDMRLFERDGETWCVATMRELNAQAFYEMVLARIDIVDEHTAQLSDWRLLTPDGQRRHEKNWMPRINAGQLEFIYALDPVRILDQRAQTLRQTTPAAALDHLRGGTQAIAFDGGWLVLTHEVLLLEGRRVYLHRFVGLDADDRVKSITEPFVFRDWGLEFAAGLAWRDDGETLVVSYGAKDSEAWLATVTAADVRAAMAPH